MQGTHARMPISDMQMKIRNKQVFLQVIFRCFQVPFSISLQLKSIVSYSCVVNLVMHIISFKGLMNLHKTVGNNFVMMTGEKMENTADDDKTFTEQFTCQGQTHNSGKYE